jgi:hypothetical protein
MVLKDDLLGWLEHAKGEYAARKKTAEARVVRWEWFTSDDRALQPFYFERNRFSRGKRLLIEPGLPREGYVAYGVDAQDRVLVEYRHYNCDPLALYDQKLLALCDKANQQIAMKDQWSVGRTLLDRVATSLRSIAWKAMMPVTEDFVVYAVDFELGNLRKSLRKAAGARQFELWQRGGHVP